MATEAAPQQTWRPTLFFVLCVAFYGRTPGYLGLSVPSSGAALHHRKNICSISPLPEFLRYSATTANRRSIALLLLVISLTDPPRGDTALSTTLQHKILFLLGYARQTMQVNVADTSTVECHLRHRNLVSRISTCFDTATFVEGPTNCCPIASSSLLPRVVPAWLSWTACAVEMPSRAHNA